MQYNLLFLLYLYSLLGVSLQKKKKFLMGISGNTPNNTKVVVTINYYFITTKLFVNVCSYNHALSSRQEIKYQYISKAWTRL